MAKRPSTLAYYKYLFLAIKAVATAIIVVDALIVLLALADLAFAIGFGYPWWSLVLGAAILAGAVCFRWIASRVLSEINARKNEHTPLEPKHGTPPMSG